MSRFLVVAGLVLWGFVILALPVFVAVTGVALLTGEPAWGWVIATAACFVLGVVLLKLLSKVRGIA